MSIYEGTIGEVIMFAGNFAPRGWAFCNGQIMSIAQNTALFSILGTTYGGNGQTTFALPNLQGRVPVGFGQGPGLPNVVLGQVSGSPTTTLLPSNLPPVSTVASTATGTLSQPTTGSLPAASAQRDLNYVPAGTGSTVPLGNPSAGQSQPFNNMQPYLGMNFIICLEGFYPSRN